MMAKALAKEGMELTHIIGPKTGHGYHSDAKVEINRRIDSIVGKGRDVLPKRVRFTTYTLRYNSIRWVTVDELTEHWEQARLNVEIRGGRFLPHSGRRASDAAERRDGRDQGRWLDSCLESRMVGAVRSFASGKVRRGEGPMIRGDQLPVRSWLAFDVDRLKSSARARAPSR